MSTASPNAYLAYFKDGRVTPVEEWGQHSLNGAAPMVFCETRQGLYDARKIDGFLRIESSRDFRVTRKTRPLKVVPRDPAYPVRRRA